MRIAITAAVLSAALAGAASAQDRPAAYTNAEACLEAKVDAAVAASSGAADAAEFLLTYLCAGPVAAATRYEVNSQLLASGKGMAEGFMAIMPATADMGDMPDFTDMSDEEFDAWIAEQENEAAAIAVVAAAEAGAESPDAAPPQDPFEGITIDPVTGDILTGDNPLGPMIVTLMDYMEATGRMMSNTPPVFLRERAAELITQRRRR